MATPSKPIRKGPAVNVSPAGTPRPGSGVPMPSKKSATPFGSVGKGVYKRVSAGIVAGKTPVNDKDAGRGTGNVRGVKRTHVPTDTAD